MTQHKLSHRIGLAYANTILRHPAIVLCLLLSLGVAATYATSRLTINSNQLDLISQDLPEVQAVKRVIDMVGGTGYLMLALRSDDESELKKVGDDLATMLQADTENVRFVTYKVPVEFMQEKIVLFVKNDDLLEGKARIMRYVRDQVRRANPFFFELTKTEPVKLDMQDLVDKYSHVGKKTILDDYYISSDRKMLLLLIKPMWDSNTLDITQRFLTDFQGKLAAYSQNNAHGVKLVEDYKTIGKKGLMTYGYSGTYKTNLDDSYAMAESLHPVTILAFFSILVITLVFFRRIAPSVLVLAGTVLGTVFTMGFTYATVGQLNMVTSILGGILMGFGVDYGIHFIFRMRIELGAGKSYDVAIRDALINAGRPAAVAAVVTGGSFFVLMVSEFRGFSQFGFLAGFGTLIIGLTLFSFCPAVLALLGKHWPDLPRRLVGQMNPVASQQSGGELRIPRPRLILSVASAIVALICAAAVPWSNKPLPTDREPTLFERLASGIRFNYNTRALMPDDQHSVQLQDEINQRFQISSDPTAIYTKTLEEAKEVYDELTQHPEKYPAVDQVVSLYSFVPEPKNAQANAEVLAAWKEELSEIDTALLPDELQEKMPFFEKVLAARPYGVQDIPTIYSSQFVHLPTTRPENHGYLTFIYPSVDLWDGKNVVAFAEQTGVITTASGRSYYAAGAPVLYARLAKIVLWDGKVTVVLAALWVLLMHFLDFRSAKLALASVIPLGVGLLMMLGIMALVDYPLNFMNIIILPILLGFGVSHGLYLLHRFLEGTSPVVALRSVGAAVASSTLTAIAGFASLLLASHNGLRSMGVIACIGLTTTLVVSFTVLAAILELIYEHRIKGVPSPDERQ